MAWRWYTGTGSKRPTTSHGHEKLSKRRRDYDEGSLEEGEVADSMEGGQVDEDRRDLGKASRLEELSDTDGGRHDDVSETTGEINSDQSEDLTDIKILSESDELSGTPREASYDTLSDTTGEIISDSDGRDESHARVLALENRVPAEDIKSNGPDDPSDVQIRSDESGDLTDTVEIISDNDDDRDESSVRGTATAAAAAVDARTPSRNRGAAGANTVMQPPPILASAARRRRKPYGDRSSHCTPCKYLNRMECDKGTPCRQCKDAWFDRGKEWSCFYDSSFRKKSGVPLPDIYRMVPFKERKKKEGQGEPGAAAGGEGGGEVVGREAKVPLSAIPSVQPDDHVSTPAPTTTSNTLTPISTDTSKKPTPLSTNANTNSISSVRHLVDTMRAEIAFCKQIISTWEGDGVRVLASRRTARLTVYVEDPALLKYLDQEERLRTGKTLLTESFRGAVMKANLEECLRARHWLGVGDEMNL